MKPTINRRRLLAAAALLSLSAAGCAPAWQVVRQAQPDPFINQRRFAVLPIDFTGLTIGEKSEAQYLAEKEPDTRASFQGDKVGMNEEFAKALIATARDEGIEVVMATGPADAPFLVRPSVSWIEPGFYVGVASAPSRVAMMVRITTPDGRILDEVAMAHGTQSGLFNPSTGQRLRSDGAGLGRIVAQYLKSRVAPEPLAIRARAPRRLPAWCGLRDDEHAARQPLQGHLLAARARRLHPAPALAACPRRSPRLLLARAAPRLVRRRGPRRPPLGPALHHSSSTRGTRRSWWRGWGSGRTWCGRCGERRTGLRRWRCWSGISSRPGESRRCGRCER
jgi:hypothetical protein